MSDPEVIYLQPRCPACDCDRQWCEDDMQGEWCDGWDGDGCTANQPSVKYVRAGIAEAQLAECEAERHEQARLLGMSAERDKQLIAERDRLREALQLIFNLPKERPSLDGSDWYDEAQVIAKQALAAEGVRSE